MMRFGKSSSGRAAMFSASSAVSPLDGSLHSHDDKDYYYHQDQTDLSPSSRNKNPFRWGRKTGDRASLVQQGSFSPRQRKRRTTSSTHGADDDDDIDPSNHQNDISNFDPLLVEMDVTSPQASTSSEASLGDEDLSAEGGALTLDDLEMIKPHCKNTNRNDDEKEEEEEALEETEALTLSFTSGMALSCEDATPENPSNNTNSSNSHSPRHSARGGLRLSSLQDQIAKSIISPRKNSSSSGGTSSPTKSSSGSSPRHRWSRKKLSGPRKDWQFERVDSEGELELAQKNAVLPDDGKDALESFTSSLSAAFPSLQDDEALDNPQEDEESLDMDDEDEYSPPLPLTSSDRTDKGRDVSSCFESRSSGDIVLRGYRQEVASPRKSPPCPIWTDDHPKTLQAGNEDLEEDFTMSPNPAQSPTKVRAALHRLGKLKKKVTQKLKKTDNGEMTSPEVDKQHAREDEDVVASPTKEKTRSPNKWAGKITKMAANSAKSVASSVPPLSPLKAIKGGRRLELVDSADEESEVFTAPEFPLPMDCYGEGEEEPRFVDSKGRTSAPRRVNDTTHTPTKNLLNHPATLESGTIVARSEQDYEKDFDTDESDSDSNTSAHFGRDAPAGTVWVKSQSGCIQHLEISFEDEKRFSDLL